MEEKRKTGIPEGKESEYYAGDITLRHPAEKKAMVTVPQGAAHALGTVWEFLRRGILLLLSVGGAYALTNAGIREKLWETLRNFISFTGGR